MHLKKLSIFEFDQYAKNHPLRSYEQSSSYAMLMAENGYDYDFMGLVDKDDHIKAASLILTKKIALNARYGYAPKGFLLNYFDEDIIREFSKALKNYYGPKGYAFIKIDPEIFIGKLNQDKNEFELNENKTILNRLERNGYLKLKDNLNFEAIQPRFNAIVPLKTYSLQTISKRCRNKITKSMRKGLSFIKGTKEDLPAFLKFVEKKNTQNEKYLKYLFHVFEKVDGVDLFFVKINFEEFLMNTQKKYEQEQDYNNYCNELLGRENSEKNLNRKMQSDRDLLSYKNDIMEATRGLSKKQEELIAGAIVLKYENRITIIASGYNTRYRRCNPNYFLHHAILEHYKDKGYSFADLNGITGDLSKESPFYGLNEFKLGFHTEAYEFIGELDFIINEGLYNSLRKSGYLAKEFNKKG